jgi:7,8-dihydropterin-6-yl-methyl-4-(beta-D-ribofuranosyl)aminobenzene 5'-phosphate synthase
VNTMKHAGLVSRIVRLTVVVLLLSACSAAQPTPTPIPPTTAPLTDVPPTWVPPTPVPLTPAPPTPVLGTPMPTRFPAVSPAAMSDLKMTILYDNIAEDPRLKADWGFAALVEYGGHTLLFDTGANGSYLLDNMRELGVDPQTIEAVILSHEHGDHTGGLKALLDTGVKPTVYMPSTFPWLLKQQVRDKTQLVEVTDALEIIPGIHTTRPVGSLTEQALVVETRDGLVVITGCAHPGAAEMVRQAQTVVDGKIGYLVGGFHFFQTVRDKLPPIVAEVHQLGVEKILPAHCTGDDAIALFRTEYGDNFVEGGVGRTLTISAE